MKSKRFSTGWFSTSKSPLARALCGQSLVDTCCISITSAKEDLVFKLKMAPRMAAVLQVPGKLCSFSYVLFVFLLFYVLDVVSITVYDRDMLLNIGSSVAQPFCWLTFSHWITNSANCGRASHTNEKQGTAVLFASQKPGCLLWFQTQPSSSRASPCTARTEQKSSQGKAECLFLYQQLMV